MKINITKDIRWALTWLFIAVCLGIVLRALPISTLPFDIPYRNIMHTHSHLALLGWVYVSLSAILVREFVRLPQQVPTTLLEADGVEVRLFNRSALNYRILFYITQLSVIGMLFSFPFQGYGAVSITFSSIFIICTYFYASFFYKNRKEKGEVSYKFARMGVFYLLLSSIGIWMMPVSIVNFGKYSDVYMCSIAFFLHFQYNGWMLSSLMGLFIRKYGWDRQYPELLQRVFVLFQIGVCGTLFISWLGYFDYTIYYIVGAISALIWIMAVGLILLLYVRTQGKTLLSSIFIGFFSLKVVMMLIGCIPQVSVLVFHNMDLVISYLHFNFLGIVSLGILLFLEEQGVYKANRWLVYLFLFAFVCTEFLVAYKGFSGALGLPMIPHLQDWLLGFTALFYFPALGWKLGSSKINLQ